MIAYNFSDNETRGKYLGLAFTGFGLGVLIGPPFGSVLFEFFGIKVPFYILAAIGAADGLLQIITFKVSILYLSGFIIGYLEKQRYSCKD